MRGERLMGGETAVISSEVNGQLSFLPRLCLKGGRGETQGSKRGC